MSPETVRLLLVMGVIPALLVFLWMLLHIWRTTNRRK